MIVDWLRGLRGGAPHRLRAGGLYAVPHDAGGYRVAKVLACADGVAHLRLYARRYPAPPRRLQPHELEAGFDLEAVLRGEDVALAIAHVPVDAAAFLGSRPRFIQSSEVTDEERAAMVFDPDAKADARG